MAKVYLNSAKLDGDRFLLPIEIVENATNFRLGEGKAVNCWIVVRNPGRYCLGMGDAVSAILRQVEQAESREGAVEVAESDEQAAIRARVMPCSISPPGPGWRVNLPKEVRRLAPDGEACRHIFLLTVGGFIELWFPDALRRALSAPISDVLL